MLAKKLFMLVLVVTLALLGVGPVRAQTTITWLTLSEWGGDIKAVVAAFEAENPDVKVELEQVPFNSLFEQIQVRLGAKNAKPDVLSVDVPLVAGYGLRGWLLPLDDAFTADHRADWLDAAVSAGSYGGSLLAAPVSTSTQLLFYNADLLTKAGVAIPGENDRLTWEQIAEIAPKLTAKAADGTTEVWGFNWEQTNRIYQLQPMPVSLGGTAIGEDGYTVDGVINSEAWVKAFTYYSQMFNTLNAAPKDDTVPMPDLFASGKLATMVAGPWNINRYIRTPLPFKWGVSRHPYFKDGAIVTATGSWHIGVNANTANPDAAKKFVRWISTGKGAEKWWRDGSGDFPAQKSVLALFATDTQFDTPPSSFLRVAADEATVNPVPRPVTPGYLEYEQILQNTFQDIINGVDVKTALDLAVSRIDSEMAKYKR